MNHQPRLVALDMLEVAFVENYRVQVAHGIMRYAQEHPEWRLLFNIESFSLTDRFDSYHELKRLGVHGLIFARTSSARIAAGLGIPAVCLSTPDRGLSIHSVTSDDEAIGREAARHFINRGFRHFAVRVSSDRPWEVERAAGFQAALAAAGYPCESFSHSYPDSNDPVSIRRHRRKEVAQRLSDWIKLLPRPLAVFATCDTRAFQFIEICNSLGIRVPQDVAVVGVDNNPLLCRAIQPSISSIEPNAARVGFEAARLLDRLMAGEEPQPVQRISIPPRGVVTRMSSDVLAVEDAAVADALRFITEKLTEGISLDDVAEAAGVSRTTLAQRFREQLGTTVNNEIARQRLERAKTLLLDTNLSMEEVGRLSGFRRPNYFNGFFRKQTGLAPGAWRSRHKGSDGLSSESLYGGE